MQGRAISLYARIGCRTFLRGWRCRMGVTGDEPEEALDVVETGSICSKRMRQRGLRGEPARWMLMVAWLQATRWMSNWAGKLVSMCLCKGTELLGLRGLEFCFQSDA